MKLQTLHITMGEVELKDSLTKSQQNNLQENLNSLGFELLDDQKQKQIEKIKNLLIQKVQSGDLKEHFSITDFLTQKIHKDYSNLSRLFSEVEGITIEQFFILQKIEKVKEWLIYNEINLSEIAWKLGYSSVAHLSAQFKKVTGLTPSAFKKFGGSRKSLDLI
ncbi:MAG: AraC family transcriptional regulator [Chitinophagaceae bacterium]